MLTFGFVEAPSRLFARGLLRVTGHRLCCGRIPEWTAHVGQPWDTDDVAPWNPYNVLWRGRQLLLRYEA